MRSTTSYALSNQPNGTYNYRVQYCFMLELPPSPPTPVCTETSNTKQVVVAVPAPSKPSSISGPSTLSYNTASGVDYSIDWANSTGTVTEYDLERKVNSGSWANVTPANTTSSRTFNDELQGTYQYRVRACNGLSCSSFSPTKTVTVTANYQLTATPEASSDGNISLSWLNPSTSTLFEVEEQVGSGSWNLIGVTGSTAFSPPNRADGTYNYRIQYCFMLEIPPSTSTRICTATSNTDQVVVTRPPGTPPSISTPGDDDNGAFTVSWGSATGVSPQYTLEREKNGSGTWDVEYTGSGTSSPVNGLADGSYKFRVKACNVGGCSTHKTSSVTYVANKPGVPSNLSAPAATATQSVALTWSAASGNPTKYYVDKRKNSGSWSTEPSVTGTSDNVSSLSDGSWQFRVRACKTVGPFTSCSNNSAITSGTTALYAGTPGSIQGPDNDPVGSYLLKWAPSTGTVSNYILQERKNSGSWSTIYDGNDPYIGIEDQVDATYDYKVKACNNIGCSQDTSIKTVVVSSTTSAPASPPSPFNPNPSSLVTSSEISATDDAGVSGGSFRVDESGSATYSMPIMTVAGTAGVVPEISLNYSSNSGNGIAGLGWNIGGLSAISRCRQTLHQDGQAKPITFSATDRFCLDGQRLILVSGTYGASGSIYKTEIDSFAKVEAFGGSTGHPDYWKVYRKDGSTTVYGEAGTNKSAELEGRTSSNTKSGKVASWGIRQLLDSANNQIVFVYSNDTSGFRVNEIRYAYAGSTALSGAGNARIKFQYATRNDQSKSYMGGYHIPGKVRLTRIISENKVGTVWKEVRRYELNYRAELSTDKLSRLDNIEECIGSNCLPNKTSFIWSLPVTGESYSNSDTSFTMESLVTYQLADFNGDGQSDIVWSKHKNSGHDQGLQVAYGSQHWHGLSTHALIDNNGSSTASIHYGDSPTADQVLKLFPFDYNADGRSDLAVYAYQAANGHA